MERSTSWFEVRGMNVHTLYVERNLFKNPYYGVLCLY